MCVAAIVLAVVAYINVRKAADARNDANAAFLDATAQRLFGESQLMLAGLQAGGSDDVLGMQELLAAWPSRRSTGAQRIRCWGR